MSDDILHMDGFEDWTSGADEYEDTASLKVPHTDYGRNGSKGTQSSTGTAHARKNLNAAYERLGSGIGAVTQGLGSLLYYHNNGARVASLYAHSDGSVSLRRGNDFSTIVVTSAPGLYDPSVFHHFFADVFFAASPNGWVKAYIDGNLVIDESGVTTWGAGAVPPNQTGFSVTTTGKVDDFYTSKGGFKGDGRVFSRFLIDDGDATDWAIGGTAPAATRWESLLEVPPDDDVTLVESVADGSLYLGKLGALPLSAGAIRGAGVVSRTYKTDAGAGNVNNAIKIGSTLYEGTPRGAPTSWGSLYMPAPVVPSLADFNNEIVQIGLRHTT